MALSTTILCRLAATLSATADLASPSSPVNLSKSTSLATGTATDQADKIYADSVNIAASSSTTRDLAGSLTDPLGATVAFATIKAVMVVASAANTNNVIIGANGSADFVGFFGDATDTISVKPGGTFLITAPETGWAVTATTADILKFANSSSGSAVDFDLVIVGTSA